MIPAVTASSIYSTLGNNNSLVPMAIKDIANSVGLTAGSYITGDELEGKDRFLDEFGTQAIWLFGIPAYKKIIYLTLYKALKIYPNFDVRNFSKKRNKLIDKTIKYADSSIKESIKNAAKNPNFSKNLAVSKFVVSTALTILTYTGLTKYRHNQTKKAAQKEILAEMQLENQNNKDKFLYTKPANKTAFQGVQKSNKQPAFTGGISEFMYNPVKNLMILDGSITGERLAESRNKQELIGYAIKEGSFWAFMYFASKPIQKFLENRAEKNNTKPVSIDLDARVIESKELEKAFKDGTLANSTNKVLKLESYDSMLDFIHNNPDDFVVQMAKKSDILPTLKNATQADNVDYRQFIDYDEFQGVASKLQKLSKKFEAYKATDAKDKTLEAFLKNVKKVKRGSILLNIGACIGALGILAPALMIAMRKFDKENQGFQVKEDLKKEMMAKAGQK